MRILSTAEKQPHSSSVVEISYQPFVDLIYSLQLLFCQMLIHSSRIQLFFLLPFILLEHRILYYLINLSFQFGILFLFSGHGL